MKEPLIAALSYLEQATGIEPALSAWEAEVLPLNYACVFRVTGVTLLSLAQYFELINSF